MSRNDILPELKKEYLLDIALRRAQEQPDRCAYCFLNSELEEKARLTYASLDQRARQIAVNLQAAGAQGERVLLIFQSPAEFVVAFLGCLYAGAIAVPTSPPNRKRPFTRLKSILADSAAVAALADKVTLGHVRARFGEYPELEALHWISTETPGEAPLEGWLKPRVEAKTLAFLQYTSGSTGQPKGVMVSYDNIQDNLSQLNVAFKATPDDITLTWLPSFHDMGLIDGILRPLFVGCQSFVMEPVAFLQRPLRWLQAISKYRATHSGGPNFGYELCLNKASDEELAALDLRSWKVAYNGAETVRQATLTRFVAAYQGVGFRPESFRPCYGLAENTLMVSMGTALTLPLYEDLDSSALEQGRWQTSTENSERTLQLVGCGQIRMGVAIVDPEKGSEQPADRVGEIWVSGGSMAQGYWNRPELSRETFQAYLPDGRGPFMRTGDLGFMRGSELYATGRIKDLIIISGRNHYPQDIEQTVHEAHEALTPNACAAFSITVGTSEELVVVTEVKRTRIEKFDEQAVLATLRVAIAEVHELQVYEVCFIKPRTMPKTTSGKVRRRQCRQDFLAKELSYIVRAERPKKATPEPAAKPESAAKQATVAWKAPAPLANTETKEVPKNTRSSQEIEDWLRRHVAQQARINEAQVRPLVPFEQYGLGSKEAIGLSGDLSDWLGQQLPPTVIYDYPNIRVLSDWLAGENQVEAKQPVSTAAKPETETDSQQTATGKVELAVLGIGCRFPGAEGPAAFWELLASGKDAVTTLPAARAQTMHSTHKGGWLHEVESFDADLFSITRREAEAMDPQQRLLLEVAYQALEHAGMPVTALAGTKTGVFLGISNSDYARINTAPSPHFGTGNALSIGANRLSYQWDLRGPSMVLDTACSSSLVALHQASLALRAGDADLALVGGVNLIFSNRLQKSFELAGMMSADGRCKTFAASADGYVRGEGVGVVVLQRHQDAQREGRRILGVIAGSAVNQDGRSNGLTAPNGQAQRAVIDEALSRSGVSPEAVGYVECHGTGTELGDPIEVGAIMGAYARDEQGQTCHMASVKTNIGHLESAAGIAGLIKVLLILEHDQIPPHLHLDQMNPLMTLAGTAFKVSTQTEAWPKGTRPRFAAVSSFGFGGTNAHVILRDEGLRPATDAVEHKRPRHLLALSAVNGDALRARAGQVEGLLATSAANVGDICASYNGHRTHYQHRLAVTGTTASELAERLASWRETGTANEGNEPQVAFLFSGQGAQRVAMGRELYETSASFRRELDRCESLLGDHLDIPLLTLLFQETGLINETAYAQPTLFSLEYALACMWRGWGIEPKALLGHSIGEYVAATLAGVFRLEDALKLVCLRGRFMQQQSGDGAMAVIFATQATVEQEIAENANTLAIAAVNGPHNTVISGEKESVARVVKQCETKGIKTRNLAVSHAFHSQMMNGAAAAFHGALSVMTLQPPQIPVISNVTGLVVGREHCDPDYWRRQMLEPVLFGKGLETLQARGIDAYLEVGPSTGLLTLMEGIAPASDQLRLPSIRHGQEEWTTMLDSLQRLYERGAEIDWQGYQQDEPYQQQTLPSYPFQRERYWLEEERIEDGPSHPLLGRSLPTLAHAPELTIWQRRLGSHDLPWLQGHRVWGKPIMPYSAFLEMAVAAARQVLKTDQASVSELSLHRPLQVPEEGEQILQTTFEQHGNNGKFVVYAAEPQRRWSKVADAQVRVT